MSPTTMTTSVPSVVKFMELRLDLQAAVADIGRLAEAGFGKRPLLKKDYQTLLDLMQEAVASAKYAAGFLRLIFQVSTPSTSSMTSSTMAARLSLEAAVGGGVDDDHPTSAVETGVLFGGEDKIFDSDSCEVSPKNVLELASDRGFDEHSGAKRGLWRCPRVPSPTTEKREERADRPVNTHISLKISKKTVL